MFVMNIPQDWLKVAKSNIYDLDTSLSYFQQLLSKHPNPDSLISYLNDRRFALLLSLLEQSECIRRFLLNHPTEFEKTIPNLWYVSKEREDYLKEIESLLREDMEDSELSQVLAFYRHRELMRIMSKEILGVCGVEDLVREYSYLPDAMLEVCYRRALKEAVEKFGQPVDEEGNPVKGTILGLGKLGSEELNYYSDIDLIFIHSSDKGGAGRLSVNEFFSKVFQKVFSLMNAQTLEGRPYITDLDLRPFGKTGPISMSVRSAELYYESYGRAWERFALLRARYCAGDRELANTFLKEVVEPFVFSGVDYRLIDEIKSMKRKIEAQASKRLSKGFNVKTGSGGIREVEFTVQSLIILLGSKHRILRESNTFRGIWKLAQWNVFSEEEAHFLERAYSFLRKLEHKVQMQGCIQTQVLKEQQQDRIARFMGYSSQEEFLKDLNYYAEGVREIFNNLIPEKRKRELEPIQVAVVSEDTEYGEWVLKEKGFKSPRQSFNLLTTYFSGRQGLTLSEKEKDILLELLPRIVELASRCSEPDEVIRNFDKFFSNPTGRKVILSEAKEDFLEGLFTVFSLSSYLSSLISKNPDLVEDVLTLYRDFPSLENLEEEFTKYKQTLELSKENLFRRFKKVWEIRIGLVFLMKEEVMELKLRSLFTSLSMLADFLMKKLWEEVGLKEERACMFALGKLGSGELNFMSDLDMVFCADGSDRSEVHRRVQRLVRFITSHTSEGYLYEVDFRLRPMGTKGELVPDLSFYRTYFQKEARTWERLAWVRARYVAGNEEVADALEKEVRKFLFELPWGERERREVLQMRKMLEQNAKVGRGIYDLKLGYGGLVDAEFLVQYLLIREKIRETSILEGFKSLMEKYPLREAYKSYIFLRAVETVLRLSKETGSSALRDKDFPRISRFLSMDEEEFSQQLRRNRQILRETFLEFLGE